MMRAVFTRFGPRFDYRGAHVTLTWNGRMLLGEIVGIFREEYPSSVKASVRHFNGEAWPMVPALSALEILDRQTPRPPSAGEGKE